MNQEKKSPGAEDAADAKAPEAPEETPVDVAAEAPVEAPVDGAVEAPAKVWDDAAVEDLVIGEFTEDLDKILGADSTAESAEALAEVERLTDKVAALNDKLLRAAAETENVRRRGAREREDAGKYSVTGFARDLLAVADNLRRALDSLSDDHRGDESLAGAISGIEMTERELLAVFERQGIRRIDPEGEKFDHNFHQAIFEVEDSELPAGTVVKVMQPGYVIADRLLRPAMVSVAKDANGAGKDAVPHIDTKT